MTDHEHMAGSHQAGANTVLDPVCGMHVEPEKARSSIEHEGKKFYFCSVGCGERFRAEPAKFLTQKSSPGLVQLGGPSHAKAPQQSVATSSAEPSGQKGVAYVCPMCPEVRESKPVPCPKCGMALEPIAVEYTCPMHPEIVRARPGNCPICGMALEPRTATLAPEEDDSELRSMTRRFWVGIALTAPLLVISMWGMSPSSPLHNLPHGTTDWLQLALATPVVLWGGWPFFQRGWASLKNRHFNMFTLIAM